MLSRIKNNGFTLIELLVVIGIILILAALIIVNVNQARMNGRDSKRISDLKSIQTALELRFEKEKSYPIRKDGWVPVSDISTDLENYIKPMPSDPLDGKSGISIVVGTIDCDSKAANTQSMKYEYFSDADGSSFKIRAPLEVRCEGLDENDGGGSGDDNMYELWGGKVGNTL